MQVSLQSQVYLVTCTVINAYAAFSNPVHWVTTFAIGVLIGTYNGRSHLRAAREGYQPGNDLGLGFDVFKDKIIRKNAVQSLALSMPSLLVTAINLLALGLISQRVQLPSGWDPQIKTFFCAVAAGGFGTCVGYLFQLDILRRDKNPDIKSLLDQTTI